MKTRRIHLTLAAAALLACPALVLAAAPQSQDTPQATMKQAQSQDQTTRPRRMRVHVKNLKGRHYMPGTVTAVDHASGIVKLDSLGMALVVHFPPSTIENLKAGDKISLLLGYRLSDR